MSPARKTSCWSTTKKAGPRQTATTRVAGGRDSWLTGWSSTADPRATERGGTDGQILLNPHQVLPQGVRLELPHQRINLHRFLLEPPHPGGGLDQPGLSSLPFTVAFREPTRLSEERREIRAQFLEHRLPLVRQRGSPPVKLEGLHLAVDTFRESDDDLSNGVLSHRDLFANPLQKLRCHGGGHPVT